jgi:hypothetical protein
MNKASIDTQLVAMFVQRDKLGAKSETFGIWKSRNPDAELQLPSIV